MADASKDSATKSNATTGEIVVSLPVVSFSKQDVGTGDTRRFSIGMRGEGDDGILFISGTTPGDVADKLELANSYVIEIREA